MICDSPALRKLWAAIVFAWAGAVASILWWTTLAFAVSLVILVALTIAYEALCFERWADLEDSDDA